MPRAMLEQCPSMMLGAMQVEQCTYVRTYERTHKEPLTLLGYLTLVSARRGADRFDPTGDENPSAAGAPRGLTALAVAHA